MAGFVGIRSHLRIAGRLSEWAVRADAQSETAHRGRVKVDQARAQAETSLMGKSIFTAAANASLRVLGDDEERGYTGSRVGIG